MQNEARGLERKGADIEERLLEFAVRVGKAIDTLPTRGLEDTLPDSSCDQERPQPPIMPKRAQRKARKILFTNLRSF